ncbi:S8 family peptidase [Aromatoleum diolicum]|uniref:S8 family serine peptidase n=1 Tax=Aromatoleum diolicum TaxID=75796 RepID=A0ABX1QBH0_9RHOO|nr:S8 family serine peptidase [Aromatoleum diolicum]NMG74366.1 S8 family serine peptidase [Aromatoleum diolicum]
MRHAAILAPLAGAFFLLSAPLAPAAGPSQRLEPLPRFAPDRVLVAFQPGTPGAEIAQAHASAGALLVKRFDAIGVHVLAVPSGTVEGAVAVYQRNPNVRYAEPNYYRPLILPTEGKDPQPPAGLGIEYLPEQWGLNNTAQALYDPETGGSVSGTVNADIDAPQAWDVSRGSDTVTIAILDSGVECTHVDLLGKCIEQKNFTISSTPGDLLGHGTHVAAIAAANTNNGAGTAGVGWNTKVASLKVCREYPSESFPLLGMCDVADSVEGLLYAADQGYRVVNMSYGSDPDPYSPSQAEADAIKYAWNKGVVLVAAAGNDYATTRHYPAAFPEVISVAATDRHDNLAYFSTFSSAWVSVAAPGHNILSAYPNSACGLPENDPEGCYNWLSGTSMASPHVAGVAALVLAHYPGITNTQARGYVENNANAQGALGQNFRAWVKYGRVNAHLALTANTPPPPPPASITLTASGYKLKGLQKADLQWSGATSTHVDIRRNGSIVSAAPENNDGAYTDAINKNGGGSYTYKVCETGTAICSNDAIVAF